MVGNDIKRVAPADIGGPTSHIPVMLNEVLRALNPAAGQTIVDGTFGAGGYGRAILQSGADLIAIDRDPDIAERVENFHEEYSEEFGQEIGDRFVFISGEFSQYG